MKLEKNLNKITTTLESKKEKLTPSLSVDLVNDNKFISDPEQDLIQAENNLELAKVRASLEQDLIDQNQAVESFDVKADLLDDKTQKNHKESDRSLLHKLAFNKIITKIALGLGIASITSSKAAASDSSVDRELMGTKIENYFSGEKSPVSIDDTTFVVKNKTEKELSPEELEEIAFEKSRQEEEAKSTLTKEAAQEAYDTGKFKDLDDYDQKKLFLKNIYKVDSVDYETWSKVEEAAKDRPDIFIREAHNYINKESVYTKAIIEDAISNNSSNTVESFLENYGNLKNIPDLNTEELLDKIVEKDAWNFLSYGHNLGGHISGEKLTNYINKACESSPSQFFSNLKNYAEIKDLDLASIVKDNVNRDPSGAMFAAGTISELISGPETIKMMEDLSSKVEPASFLNAYPTCSKVENINKSAILSKKILESAEVIPSNFIGPNLAEFRKVEGITDENVAKIANKLEQESPAFFLGQVVYLKDVKGLDLKTSIDQLYNKDVEAQKSFLWNADEYADIKGLDLISKIKELAPKHPNTFLEKAASYKGIKNLDLGSIITEISQNNLDPNQDKALIRNAGGFKDIKNLDLATLVTNSAVKEKERFLMNIDELKGIKNLDLGKLVTDIAPSEGRVFLSNINSFKDIKSEDTKSFDLNKLIIDIAPTEGQVFMENINDYKDINNLDLKSLVNSIAPSQGDILFQDINNFKNIPDLKLGELVNILIPNQEKNFLKNIENFKDIPGVKFDIIINNLAKKNTDAFLINISHFTDIPNVDAEQLLLQLTTSNPKLVMQHANCLKYIKNKEVKSAAVEKMIALYPEAILKNKSLLNLVDSPKIKVVQVLKNMKSMDAFLLLDEMVRNDMPEEEAMLIIGSADKLLPKLLDIKARPNHLAKSAIDDNLYSTCRNVVLTINSLHNSPDDLRFKSLASFNARELYTIMAYGEDEIFTSSFNGCFDRLMGKPGLVGKMETEKINSRDLLDQVGNNKFRTFVKECTWFNRLEEFLAKMDKKDSDQLLRDVVKNIETTDNKMDQAVTLAEIFGGAKDPATLKVLQEQIKLECERLEKNQKAEPEDKVMYGLLAGMFKDNAVNDKEWFAKMGKDYPMGRVTGLENKKLFNENGVFVQKYHFFEGGDRDGINSFNNFIEGYKADSATWKIDESQDNYVVITGQKDGRTIEIYANNPNFGEQGEEGLKEINELMNDKKIEPALYSYRGHSTNVSLDGVSKETKIINLGSCGGFNRINDILNLAPESHVISTKGTGTRYVNDPIFKDLNDYVLTGKDINWREFWDKETKKLEGNKNFANYVAPHNNQGMMFMKAHLESVRAALEKSLAGGE